MSSFRPLWMMPGALPDDDTAGQSSVSSQTPAHSHPHRSLAHVHEDIQTLGANATQSKPSPLPSTSSHDAAGQLPKDGIECLSLIGASSKRRVTVDSDEVPVAPDKRHYQEVDYSQSLRKELHKKEELVQRLRLKVQQQGSILKQGHDIVQQQQVMLYNQATSTAQREFNQQKRTLYNMQAFLQQQEVEINTLRAELKAQAREHVILQAQFQCDKELSAESHRQELHNLRHQFESNMRAQMDDLLKASSTNLASMLQQREREMQEQTAQMEMRMMVDKERELANMEQRYARHGKNVATSSSSSPDSDVLPAAPLPNVAEDSQAESFVPQTKNQIPQRPPTSTLTTPSLDAIKRIKKSCRVSRRTRLVGVFLECHNEESSVPPVHSAAPEVPRGEREREQMNAPQVLSMAETIAMAVEDALRNILGNQNMFEPVKCSPRWRKNEDEQVQLEKATEPTQHRDFILSEVRRLFRDKFGITQDADVITHAPAAAADVHAYEYEDGTGPDWDALVFDLTRSYTSLWNSNVLEMLLRELQQCCEQEKWPVTKPDNYIREALKNRYKKLRTTWLKAQPKLTRHGVLESPTEATHHRNKYRRRVAVLNHIVQLRTETADEDLPAWKWLQHLIKVLGEHGMSSEESSVENEVEHVLHVKKMEWRRCIDQELDLVDVERILDSDIFSPQGAKPVKRIRAPDNPMSSRDAVRGLPLNLYDGAWIAGLTQCELDSLEAIQEGFNWMTIAVA
ncbi:hypothetical protein HD554DRAFT_2174942 [Boletus coccyginus]|nr:hypothetical protein HD554DRAFT_2174942 [Boletus coccyginus]